jgi:hypothetical protein
MRDAELSACYTAACSMRACASRRKLHASGVEGSGMDRSSFAAAMSFWHTRSGACGSSMLKSALLRSRRRVRVVDVEVDVDALAGV